MNLMRSIRRTALSTAVLVAATHAGAQTVPIPFPDLCLTASPHVTYTLPASPVPKVLSSGSGGYAYGISSAGCRYFRADVQVAPASYVAGQLLTAGAYDLPSSTDGVNPGNPTDCARLRVDKRYYRKLSTQTVFTKLGSVSLAGKWVPAASDPLFSIPAHCELQVTSGFVFSPTLSKPSSGVNTYRMAVRVKLRSSYQEAAVRVEQAVKPPN